MPRGLCGPSGLPLALTWACIQAMLVSASSAKVAATVLGSAEPQRAGPSRVNLLQAGRLTHEEGSAAATRAERQQPPDWFSVDMEKMDELPNYNIAKKKCHPTCKWNCGNTKCDSKCKPICKPPKCATSCKKPIMSKCQRKCKDPNCAVVCPPQCEHGQCPQCTTVCNKPVCLLDCGRRCESHCADPECTWDCKDDDCQKPDCKLECESPKVCELGKLNELPPKGVAPYVGQDVAWQGLGKVPQETLANMRAVPMNGSLPMGGADLMGGAKMIPVTAAAYSGWTVVTDIEAPAKIVGPTRWALSGKVRSPYPRRPC